MKIYIDLDTIKKNPNAGKTQFAIPGPLEKLEDGSIRRNIEWVYSLTPDPEYLYKYNTTLECPECHHIFPLSCFKIPDWTDRDDTRICPSCEFYIDIEYETLGEALIRQGQK